MLMKLSQGMPNSSDGGSIKKKIEPPRANIDIFLTQRAREDVLVKQNLNVPMDVEDKIKSFRRPYLARGP